MHRPLPTFYALALGALTVAPLTAQKAGTTLAALVDRADAIVVAQVVRAVDPDASTRAWTFVRRQALKGSSASAFELRESAGRACGRALGGLMPGQRVLLFMSDAGGSLRLVSASGRAAPLAAADLVGHVQALARTTDATGRSRLLLGALNHGNARVREDAALALPGQPGLESLSATEHVPILTALHRARAAESSSLPALTQAAARLRLNAALDALLPTYLEGESLPGFYLNVLPRFDHGAVARRLAAHDARAADDGGQRAIALAARLQTPEVLPVLWRYLRETSSRQAATGAARALLTRGVSRTSLSHELPANLLDRAQREAATPRFRSILRTRTR